MTATYSDITEKFTFSCPHNVSLGLSSTRTMDNCVDFPNSYTTYTTYNATAVTTTITRPNVISITLNTTDRYVLLIILELIEMFRLQQTLCILVQLWPHR